MAHVLPSTLFERLYLFQGASLALQQSTIMTQPTRMNRFHPSRLNLNYQTQNIPGVPPRDIYAPTGRLLQGGLLQDIHRSVNEATETVYQSSSQESATQGLLQLRTDSAAHHGNDGISSVARSAVNSPSSGLDASAQAPLPSLEAKPIFTEEQEAMELATMTDEERAEALIDMFGRKCAVGTPKRKRARKDLDKNETDFLVNQMRLEIERIPEARKRALLEAQIKCRAAEFSDARLERFLRCECLNVKVRSVRNIYMYVTVGINFQSG
jgi:hypothetical protein